MRGMEKGMEWSLKTAAICVTVFLAGVSDAATAASSKDSKDVNTAILKELREIKAQLRKINEKLDENLKNPLDVLNMRTFSSGFTERKTSLSALSKVKLPKNPTDADVKKYIYAIMWLTKGQNTFSPSDPQLAMFMNLGASRLPIMIQMLGSGVGGGMDSYHLLEAIIRLADEKHKKLILKALPLHKALVRAVVSKGWEKDARQELLDGLKDFNSYLPDEWLGAVINLNDSASYPLLRDYFIKGRGKARTYRLIRFLPIKKMDEAVAKAWERSRYSDRYNMQSMAMVAVGYGHLDALECLVNSLGSNRNRYWCQGSPRSVVLRHIDFSGDNNAIQEWFAKNRKRLVFDKTTKKFRISKEK